MANETIDRLVSELCRLPGVGRKSAQRFAYHILGMDKEDALSLAGAITAARELIHPCPVCGGYTDRELCEYCSNPARSEELLCIVSNARDITSMEKTREYSGRYHVLGGLLSPADGIGPEELRLGELLKRCKGGKVREVILATDSDVKGDVTAAYIAKLLKPLGITVTRIARGIPIGGNLEYTDEITLAKALEGRREM